VSKTILIVDDEAHIRHVLALKLQSEGYRALTAMDGEEALEVYAAEKPDLMITDYQMPYLSGLDLCRQLRQHKAGHVPIIMLTARGFDLTIEEMAEAGIDVLIAKPFSPKEVAQKVGELLRSVSASAARE
jgi:two-component system response regulator ResD